MQDALVKKIVTAYNDIKKFPTLTHVQLEVGLSKSALMRRIKLLREDGVKLIDRESFRVNKEKLEDVKVPEQVNLPEPKVVRENNQLKQMVKALKEQLEAAHMEAATTERLTELIHGTKDFSLDNKAPDWLRYTDGSNQNKGTPVLVLSDIHFDEVVEADQIGGVNHYDHDTCVRRLTNCFNTFLDILVNKMSDTTYNGAVIALGGDIVSGNIHEELAETNDATITQTILSAVKILGDGIEAVAEEIGRVYVPCVVGNHGRIHKKPRFKYKVQHNYEWLIYQLLALRFAKDDRIKVEIPEGSDCLFKVHNLTFLLTHGDQFKGGSGISGILTPLMLGMSRKQKKYSALGKPFDVMICGHFHQYIQTNHLIVNGSVKGYDEYADNFNFAYEEPQQAMFLVHPELGITLRLPIKCDR
jgi:predicted phosphodiesterase